MYELHKISQRTEAQVNNSAKTIEHLKEQAEEAQKGQQELLVQNRELKLMGQEAERMRLKLLSQNEELKEKLEQQERQFKLQQEQDDKSRLTAFENVLEVRRSLPMITSTLKLLTTTTDILSTSWNEYTWNKESAHGDIP